MERSPHLTRRLAWLLTAMYTTGLVGLNLSLTQNSFRLLVPYHLWFHAGLLFWLQPQKNRAFLIFATLTFLSGFWAEWAGVTTGLIFGEYAYGETLGWKILGIPVVIGANWFMLVYAAGITCRKIPVHWLLQATIAALMMTVLDFFIEPVAIRLDFWQWQNGRIPLQNFAGWFGLAFALQMLFSQLDFQKENSLARLTLIWQFAFFALQVLFFL
jgi:bisanhydrobacterioruberin hydratase